MKTLSDGKQVLSGTYYYLLDFNERDNWVSMINLFNKKCIFELNIDEYRKLFEHATEVDKLKLI